MESVKLPKTHWPIAKTESAGAANQPQKINKKLSKNIQLESSAHLTGLAKFSIQKQVS